MNDRDDNPADPAPIDLAAADWLVRRDRGFTAEEQDEFFQWLAADPRHGEWFARHQQTWKTFNLLAEWRPEHASEPNPDLLAQPARARPRFQPARLAAAAGVAVLLAALALWRGTAGEGGAEAPAPVAVAQGYERRVLEDGSVLELNRGAAVSVHYTASERAIELQRGEAHFTVAKNPARPFLVRAAGVAVRAVGTAFNVRRGAAAVEVLVTEGRIEVQSPDAGGAQARPEPATLIAGQRAVVPLAADGGGPVVTAVTPEDTARLLAWQPQLLDFSSTPLAEVVAEFNRRNAVRIVVADPEIAAIPIVASFRSDNVDAFLRLLEVTADVRVERRGPDEIVLHRAR